MIIGKLMNSEYKKQIAIVGGATIAIGAAIIYYLNTNKGEIIPSPECSVDTDCAAGQVCQNGKCVTSGGDNNNNNNNNNPPTTQCKSDSDCGAGYKCENNMCVVVVPPPPSGGTATVSNLVCQSGSSLSSRFMVCAAAGAGGTVIMNYGDGAQETIEIADGVCVFNNHTYTQAGTYTVTASGTNQKTISVTVA